MIFREGAWGKRDAELVVKADAAYREGAWGKREAEPVVKADAAYRFVLNSHFQLHYPF